MTLNTLFTPVRYKSDDNAYEFYLNSQFQSDVRRFVDDIYESVAPFIGDTNIEDMIQTDFHGTVWQLYVAWAFQQCGHVPIIKARPHGPDVELGDGTIIEAVVVRRGDGPDKPFAWSDEKPMHESNGIKIYHPRSMPYPDPQIILRITQAIEAKRQQRIRWVRDAVVREDQPFVIAVNAGLIDEAKDAWGGSYGARTVFALGKDVIHIPVNLNSGIADTDKSTTRTAHAPSVTKKSGSEVKSDLFLADTHADVSGLLYCPHHIGNIMLMRPFETLEYLGNGLGSRNLRKDLLRTVRYTWANIDRIEGFYKVETTANQFSTIIDFLKDYFRPYTVNITLSPDGGDFSVIINREGGLTVYDSFRVGTRCRDVVEKLCGLQHQKGWSMSAPQLLGQEIDEDWLDSIILASSIMET